MVFDRTKVHFTGPTFTVEGSLSLTTPDGPIELAMDDDSCFAADVRSSETTRQAPRGRPLSNDAIEERPADRDRITVATEEGVTYWIQVGGFFGAYGSLVLSVE